MLLQLIRFFRGFVTFKIIGSFPERFINLSLKNGIGIFDAEPKDGTLYASMVISDYRLIRPIARRSGVKLRITKRHGLPFIAYRFKARWGIAAGVALFLIISLVMQNFVWTVELNGVETLSETSLLNSLREAGFAVGKFKGSLDLHKIERQIQLEYEKIGWMSINLIGTHAEIEIKEKAMVPENEYSSEYSNIKSSADGIILSTNVRRGTAEVTVGSAVSEGQLLVSGMYENALEELHFVDADAEIIAQTSYSFTATTDERAEYFAPDAHSLRSGVSLLWFDFPLTCSPELSTSSSYTENLQAHLYNNPIPLTLHREHLYSYKQEKKNLTAEEAQGILTADLALYKLFNLSKVRSIAEKTEISKEQDTYKICTELTCTEDIAVKENLIVNSE